MNEEPLPTEELAPTSAEAIEATVDNTKATDANTLATVTAGNPSNVRVERDRMVVCGLAIVATLCISWFNPKFAETQAGLILSGVVGGIFGAAVGQIRR